MLVSNELICVWLPIFFFFLEGMKKDAKDYVGHCYICQTVKYSTEKPYGLLQPTELLERVGGHHYRFFHRATLVKRLHSHTSSGRLTPNMPTLVPCQLLIQLFIWWNCFATW